MRTAITGFQFQIWRLRQNVDELQGFFLAPLFTLIFGGMALAADHRDELPMASVGAALICVWWICAQAGGNIIARERWQGTLEPLAATPSPLQLLFLGRATAVVAVASLVFPEVWLITLLAFGERIPIAHPALLLVTLFLTVVGFQAATTVVAATFVLARQAVVVGNATSYPVFFLSGLMFPVSDLPAWLQPLSRLLFLSWSSDLLRVSLGSATAGHVLPHVLGLAGTSLATTLFGLGLLSFTVKRARTTGTLNLA